MLEIRLECREECGDGDAREDEGRGALRAVTEEPHEPGERHGDERTDERGELHAVEEAAAVTPLVDEGNRRTEASARRNAKQIGVGERVAEDALEGGARGRQGRIEPQDWGRIVALSLLWVAIPFTLFPLAQEHINSAVTGLLNGATPVFAAIISVLFVKVVPKGVQLWGLAVGFGGVVLISFASSGSGTTQLLGVILVLAATGCYGISLNIAPPLQAKYGAVTLMSAVLTLATIWVLPFGLVSLGDSTWSVLPVLAVVALGAIGTGFAYWIMSSLVGRVGGIRASFITYLIPVVSLVLGVAIRGDVVRPLAIVGAVMTILGAFFASRRSRT